MTGRKYCEIAESSDRIRGTDDLLWALSELVSSIYAGMVVRLGRRRLSCCIALCHTVRERCHGCPCDSSPCARALRCANWHLSRPVHGEWDRMRFTSWLVCGIHRAEGARTPIADARASWQQVFDWRAWSPLKALMAQSTEPWNGSKFFDGKAHEQL